MIHETKENVEHNEDNKYFSIAKVNGKEYCRIHREYFTEISCLKIKMVFSCRREHIIGEDHRLDDKGHFFYDNKHHRHLF